MRTSRLLKQGWDRLSDKELASVARGLGVKFEDLLNQLPDETQAPDGSLGGVTLVQLAKAFIRQLTRVLTGDERRQAVFLNKQEQVKGVCHTHDFCDPNQCMIDAYEELGLDLDPMNDEHARFMNEAWAMASRAEFSLLNFNSLLGSKS